MKSTIILLTALFTTGCAQITELIKPTAAAGLAVLQFDDCKAELESYLPDEILSELDPEFERVEKFVSAIGRVAQRDVDMTLDTARKAANITTTLDEVEKDFLKITEFTLAYTDSDREPSQFLIECDKTLRAGFKGLRDSGPAASAREFMVVAGPYFKSAVKLLPLLLMNDGPKPRAV